MRNGTFFPRLALVNLVRGRRFYGPYLLTCGALAAMYYVLRFLIWNDVVDSVYQAPYLRAMLGLGCGVVAAFSGVILLYANGFVMKRRQRELGLYQVLGLEKRHIAATLLWETLLCAGVSLLGGLAAGVALSRGLLALLLALVRIPVDFPFSVSLRAMGESAGLMAVLFLLALGVNLLAVGRSQPVELLQSVSAGQREPRTKKLLAAVGVLTLGAGYALAVTTQNPVDALALFFLAVVLVMIGTYCLFTAGSVAVLKRLRADRRFYYQTRHFTAVSGLLYRMKQNAVGLANICILSSMVLVTVSATLCLYLGIEDALAARIAEGILPAARQAEMAQNYYLLYGGFLFVGMFLGLLFLLATVLIIYYKQLSEGYEDQRRYQIMQQVGMTGREVRASIRSQILLVFFLPLGAAALHILLAFGMLCRILELFGLYNIALFALCTGGTLLVFCGIYALVFGLTARTYERIVGEAA
ncbi:FtsX-like permease family protein [uncultured Oscillibacter sp.]|uniref:FtsX-like permease family protein n=1 Tax=uncultured Oscillibacter sp. TaxID=876091 RepID=UPI0025D6E3BC|nr:FtsX-like permease family protein [uncultured Oscillibacter sp.]